MNMFGFVWICLTAYSSIAFISSCQPWSVYVWPWASQASTVRATGPRSACCVQSCSVWAKAWASNSSLWRSATCAAAAVSHHCHRWLPESLLHACRCRHSALDKRWDSSSVACLRRWSTCLSGSIIFTVAVVLSSHLDISAWHGLGCQTPSKPPPPLSPEGLRRSGSLCPCLQKSPISSHVASGSRPSHQRSPTSSVIGNLWPSLQIGHVFSIKSWSLLLASQSSSRIPLCQPPANFVLLAKALDCFLFCLDSTACMVFGFVPDVLRMNILFMNGLNGFTINKVRIT